MVPQVIHCCWLGGSKPRLIRKCQASWARFASAWRVHEWDAESARALCDLPGYDFFRAALAARQWAMASDWLRMAALWKEGGVYLDCDVELVAPLDALCADGAWIASEWTAAGETWLNPGSGLALARGSSVAEHMLAAYAHLAFDARREMMPWINEQLAEAGARACLRVLTPEVMSPIDIRGHLHRTPETVGIHHCAMSWVTPRRRIARWLSWHGLRGLVDTALRLRNALRLN